MESWFASIMEVCKCIISSPTQLEKDPFFLCRQDSFRRQLSPRTLLRRWRQHGMDASKPRSTLHACKCKRGWLGNWQVHWNQNICCMHGYLRNNTSRTSPSSTILGNQNEQAAFVVYETQNQQVSELCFNAGFLFIFWYVCFFLMGLILMDKK